VPVYSPAFAGTHCTCRPTEGWPGWVDLSACDSLSLIPTVDGLPANRRSPIPVLTGHDVEQPPHAHIYPHLRIIRASQQLPASAQGLDWRTMERIAATSATTVFDSIGITGSSLHRHRSGGNVVLILWRITPICIEFRPRGDYWFLVLAREGERAGRGTPRCVVKSGQLSLSLVDGAYIDCGRTVRIDGLASASHCTNAACKIILHAGKEYSPRD